VPIGDHVAEDVCGEARGGIGGCIGRVQRAIDTAPVRGVVFWYGDHLGSTTLRTKSDGVLLERVVYRPYGEAIQVAGVAAAPPEFRYTGQRFEKSVGIYDYGARWYVSAQ